MTPGKSTFWLVFGSISDQYAVAEGSTSNVSVVCQLADVRPGSTNASAVVPTSSTAAESVSIVGPGGAEVDLPAHEEPVWQWLGLAPSMRRSVRATVGDHAGWIAPRAPGPVALLAVHNDIGAWGDVEVLATAGIRATGLQFARVGVVTGDGLPAVLEAAMGVLNNFNGNLLTESQWYDHGEPGTEIEVKLTLLGAANTWSVAAEIGHAVSQGQFLEFVPLVGKELQRWEFDIDMFEVVNPASERGYISFSPNPDGSFVVHRKIFVEDELRRTEGSQYDVHIPEGDVLRYLALNHAGLTVERLSRFRRCRFDVNVESTRTGHLFGIEVDEVTVRESAEVLRQVEIEYHETRIHDGYKFESIEPELERLTSLVSQHLTKRSIPHEQSYYSKLSFLRDVRSAAPPCAGRCPTGSASSASYHLSEGFEL